MKSMTAIAPHQSQVLAAMLQIATLGGTLPLTTTAEQCLQACGYFLFQTPLHHWSDLPPILPAQLAAQLPDQSQRQLALQLITVMAFVEGVFDPEKINLVLAYADALGVHESYIQDLVETNKQHWAWVLSDMNRRNIESVTGEPWADGDVMAWLLPYQSHPDAALESQFQALSTLPVTTLGYKFWDFYQEQRYAFPGNPQGLNQDFAVPHDCTHILANYDTSPTGEILVSTFTAAMHQKEAMAGHILPVLYTWHLGVKFNDVAGATRGALVVEAFWQAWARGAQTTVDLFDPTWDFWAVADQDVAELRQVFGVETSTEL